LAEANPIWIISGHFGRATVNVTQRGLVEHAHQQFNLIFKLGGADTEFKSSGQMLSLDDDSALFFNPWVPHLKEPNASGATMILSLIVEQRFIDSVLERQGLNPGLMFPRARETITEDVRIHSGRLAAAVARSAIDPTVECEPLLTDLIDSCVSNYIAPEIERSRMTASRPIDYRIRKALTYMHEHVLESPRIDDIAAMVGLSRSRFFEQFKRCVGASPQHYIDHLRMKLATRWLSTTDRPLVELADELGFGAHSNFTRFFTQHIAVSPSEFRRQTQDVSGGEHEPTETQAAG